jgi:hypothetical protein
MTNGVDPTVHAVEAAGAQAPVDLILAPPKVQQLFPAHHPVLSPSQIGQRPIISASP